MSIWPSVTSKVRDSLPKLPLIECQLLPFTAKPNDAPSVCRAHLDSPSEVVVKDKCSNPCQANKWAISESNAKMRKWTKRLKKLLTSIRKKKHLFKVASCTSRSSFSRLFSSTYATGSTRPCFTDLKNAMLAQRVNLTSSSSMRRLKERKAS